MQIWFWEHFEYGVRYAQNPTPTFPVAARWRGVLGRKYTRLDEVDAFIDSVPQRTVNIFLYYYDLF